MKPCLKSLKKYFQTRILVLDPGIAKILKVLISKSQNFNFLFSRNDIFENWKWLADFCRKVKRILSFKKISFQCESLEITCPVPLPVYSSVMKISFWWNVLGFTIAPDPDPKHFNKIFRFFFWKREKLSKLF